MKTAYLLIASLLTATATLTACGVERSGVAADAAEGYYFSGYVYDGVSAAPLRDYQLTLQFNDAVTPGAGEGGATGATELSATVDASGRYHVGPLKPQSDFTITIEAEGYRAFTSHNPLRTTLPGTDDQQRTEIFEAYLFPSGLEAPGITLDLFSVNNDAPRPTGTVRLSPTNGDGESDLSLAGTLGASVGAQLWFNDDDARNATVIKPLENGVLLIEAADLVYGVTYTGTVYGVEGHAYQDFTFTAGLTGSQTVLLDELDDSGLYVVSTSVDNNVPNADGTLTLVFNRDIEIAPSQTAEFVAEVLDDNFTIDSPDADGDLTENVLATAVADDPDTQENGTSFEIDGNRLILSWANVASSFDTRDTDDPILSVNWAGFDQIVIQAKGDIESDTLDDLAFGNTNIDVQVTPTAP